MVSPEASQAAPNRFKILRELTVPLKETVFSAFSPPAPPTLPEIPKIPESLFNEKPFCVVFPGWLRGGEGLTDMRQKFDAYYGAGNNYVESSISDRNALKKGENLTSHYRHIAELVDHKMKGNKIRIFGHSAGTFEASLFIEELLNVWGSEAKGKEIELVILCAPGFGKRGPDGLVNFTTSFTSTFDHSRNEQHTAFPLPEGIHKQLVPEAIHPNIDSLFKDTPKKREERRLSFNGYLDRVIQESEKRDKLLNQVWELDRLMGKGVSDAELARLVAKRGLLISPYVLKLFYGEQKSTEEHQFYSQNYHETEGEIETSLIPYALAYMGIARLSLSNIYKGSEKGLASLVQLTRSKSVGLSYALAFCQLDPVMSIDNLDPILRQLIKYDIWNEFAGCLFLDTLYHASVTYFPEAILPKR